MLAVSNPIGFIPTRNAEAARAFYEGVLGLYLESSDPMALVFRLGPARATMLRIVCAGDSAPATFTVFGWEVTAIESCVDQLAQKGVEFLRVPHCRQDERGIWDAPGGARIAWFKDPDGNTLSISRHPH